MSSVDARTLQVGADGQVNTAVTAVSNRHGVLHLINNFEVGGTERQAIELLKRIDRERFDIRLAALSTRGPLYSEISSQFDIQEFPISGFLNVNAIRQLLRLRSFLVSESIRILHAHDFYAGVIGSLAAKGAGVKLIASQRHLRLSDRKAHLWGTNVVNRLADRLLVNSNPIRDYIIASDSSCAQKIVVIENGLAIDKEKSEDEARYRVDRLKERLCSQIGLTPSTRLIGMLARLQPVKGHRVFVEASALLLQKEPSIHFVLIGGGPLRDELQTLAHNLGIGAHVHFLGERPDGRELISAVDLAVMSSLHEGLPNALMEAMSAGVPVVATAVGGVRELVTHGETGYLVEAGNSAALADQMFMALRDYGKSSELARRARGQILERFGMQRMVKSVESLYEQMLNEDPKGKT
jgi:glycosyltransferase involved in cell wall biosynthesis